MEGLWEKWKQLRLLVVGRGMVWYSRGGGERGGGPGGTETLQALQTPP